MSKCRHAVRPCLRSCSAGWYCASKADIQEHKDAYGSANVVLVGCGPVGLMAILAAQAQGATQVSCAHQVEEALL